MNKLISLLVSACFLGTGAVAADVEAPELTEGCKSAYLIDYNSGECVYALNENERMPIASVCKVMTLTLCLDAVEQGKIATDEKITVSDRASGMGGSQIFLQSGCEYTVDQLLKSIVVCSANDSCVAMSEAVCGSEEQFVAQMNKKAEDLGCANTLFVNCTGLPGEGQYSCAKDVAIMFRNLISHESYFKYSKIWLEDFVHPDDRTTTMTNTNKLIRKYKFCDGGKTGFTNDAGFCLAATAVKDNLRFVSVVLGANSSDNRFASTVKMFDYGFANYKNRIVLDKNVTLNDEFKVIGGKKDGAAVKPERNCYVFSSADKSPDITFNIISYKLKAPVACGQRAGAIEVYKDGVLYDTIDLVCAEDVKKAGFADNFKDVAEDWAI